MRALALTVLLCIAAGAVFAAGSADKSKKPLGAAAASEKGAPVQIVQSVQDISAEEMISDITDTLNDNEEIIGFIQGLKTDKGPDGKIFFTFNDTKLEKLAKEQLKALYNRVNQERTRLSTERIQEQMETIRQAQQATNISSQAAMRNISVRPPQPPPSAPQTQNVQPPKAPPAPPQLPRR